MLKISIGVISGFVIGASVTFLWMSEKNNTKPSTDFLASCPSLNTEGKNLDNALLQENTALLELLKNAQTKLNKASVSSISNHYTAQISPDCSKEVNNTISVFNEKDKIVSELQTAKSLHDYATNLYDQFINEEPNEVWAKNVESKFYHTLNNNPDTQAIVVSSLECRSRTCKIKIPAADQLIKDRAMEVISEPSFLKTIGFNNARIRPSMETAGGEVTLYISNNQ